MPGTTISVSLESKKIINDLRKKIPNNEIPTQQATADLIIRYAANYENEFLKWTQSSKEGAK
jgi:hypothetical protein